MGNLIATIFSRLVNLRIRSAITKPQASEVNEEEEINEAETPQLPDTVLRSVFKKLEFCDIKNCRLVCKQWHRFALDNFKFMLAVDHVCPTEPGGNAIPASEQSNSMPLDQDRFRFKLIPFSAATDPTTIRASCEDRAKLILKPATELQMHQLVAIINDSFKPKIHYVQLFITKQREMPPLFRAFADSLPAAELICVTQQGNEVVRLDGIWAVFERDSGQQIDRSALKLRKMRVRQDYIERASPATMQLLANEAVNMREIVAAWPCIQKLLEHHETNDNGDSLLFDECQSLVCGDVLNRGSTPFLRISSCFHNVQELTWSAGRLDEDRDFANLERLVNLKTLHFFHRGDPDHFELPNLLLPSSVSTLTLVRCLLPANSNCFVSSGLKSLCFGAVEQNMRRLAAHARDGGNNLANLKTLILERLDWQAIQTSLRIILRTADRLEWLELRTQWPGLPVAELESIFLIWTDIAKVSPRLKQFYCPLFVIPDGLDCFGLVKRIIGRMKQAKLNAAVVVPFTDNAGHGLFAALLARATSIKTVEPNSMHGEAVMTWQNGGIQQMLTLAVFSQDAE